MFYKYFIMFSRNCFISDAYTVTSNGYTVVIALFQPRCPVTMIVPSNFNTSRGIPAEDA